MKEKTKAVTIGENRFQLRRLSPEVGSFILMRMLAAGIKSAEADQQSEPANPDPQAVQPTGEQMVLALAFGAFLRGLDYETFSMIQQKCMAVVSLFQGEAPVPIMTDSGRWAFSDISDDVGIVMRLTVEVLVFNLADFFDKGGLSALMSPGPTSKP